MPARSNNLVRLVTRKGFIRQNSVGAPTHPHNLFVFPLI